MTFTSSDVVVDVARVRNGIFDCVRAGAGADFGAVRDTARDVVGGVVVDVRTCGVDVVGVVDVDVRRCGVDVVGGVVDVDIRGCGVGMAVCGCSSSESISSSSLIDGEI